MKDVRHSLQLTEAIKIVGLTFLLPNVLPLSSPKLRHGRQLALLYHPNLTLNLCTLSFVLLLALLPPLLSSVTGSSSSSSLPGNWFWSLPITRDLTCLSPSQRSCVAEPQATFLSSVDPCALKSLTCPFAHTSPLLKLLQLPLTSPHPPQLSQTKLPILC